MRRLLIVLVAATAIVTATPVMAHRHHQWNGAYGGWGGYGRGHRSYKSTSLYSGGYHRPANSYPVYPYYAAPAFGHAYGYGLPYPYANNYLFGFGGAF